MNISGGILLFMPNVEIPTPFSKKGNEKMLVFHMFLEFG